MDGRGRQRVGRGGGRVGGRVGGGRVGGRGRGEEQYPGRRGRGRWGAQDPGRGGRGRGEEQDQGGGAGGNAAAAAVEAAEAAAAAAVNAGPFPGVGANPFFVGVPSCNFQLSAVPLEMRNNHERLWIWLKRRLGGLVAKVLINHNGEVKEFCSLPEGGFFIVNLIPPEDLQQHDGRPIPLVFSFRDLYLVGFLHEIIWYVYEDAKLNGTGYVESLHGNFLKKLTFTGGYRRNMFEKVSVDYFKLCHTYNILAQYQQQIDQHLGHVVEVAMYRLIIVMPEAWRFPGWKSYLQDAFTNFTAIFVNDTVTGVKFSPYFQKWGKISSRILDGPVDYTDEKHIEGFSDYESLLPAVSIVLP